MTARRDGNSADRPARSPHVSGATFFAPRGAEGPTHMQVAGEHFLARAVPLFARLGEQVVQRVALRPGGRGFTGMLERPPREGDQLFVGYADGALAPTTVVYRGGNPPPRVA
jgi:hypothetical protein